MKRHRKRPVDRRAAKPAPPDGGTGRRSVSKRSPWLFGLLLAAATFLAYCPAWHGGFVWDDDFWTTRLTGVLQDGSGLCSIWLQPAVLQQYYPLTGTTFWLDYQLWGFWTLPYHLENILLHALAAWLFWRLLLRLELPGAELAAACFALHPVMVQSVAWITERKNVLSLVLYLGAWLAYQRFAQRSGGRRVTGGADLLADPLTRAGGLSSLMRQPALFYCLSLALFLGALLAKTTAFSLPAVILLVAWWQRSCLRWRADVVPTLPFFALAGSLCLLTAWVEKHYVGAQGSDFDWTFLQRCLVAGRVPWFYLGRLLWPTNLCFVYPRWQPDVGVWWQWMYPAGTAGVILLCWCLRKCIGRGPLTAVLYFGGTLFPLLGFLDAYGMRYSFVWDHWVYLPSLGILALVAALVARAGDWLKCPAAVHGFAVIVLPTLAILTWREAGTYRDMETLWRTTIARNPNCWMAYDNLGGVLSDQGKLDEATQNFVRALQLKPDDQEALNNLGVVCYKQMKLDEAIRYYARALQLNPDYADAHSNLGVALVGQGRLDEAIRHYLRALQLKPYDPEARGNLGIALARQGKQKEAIQQLQLALVLATAHGNTALAEGIRARLKIYQAQPQFTIP